MNLAEAIRRGLIAEAIPARPVRARSVKELARAGLVSVRVHEAQLQNTPFDYAAAAAREGIEMGSRIRCFWLGPTEEIELSLRRYRGSDRGKCATSGFGYHNVNAIMERTSFAQLAARGWPMSDGRPVHTGDSVPHSDPRWPRSCSCGYAFADDDEWQCNPDALFRRGDTGELVTLHAAPAGAMWDADWMGEHHKGPDWIHLCVRTPGGEWSVDGPSYQDGKVQHERGWTRTGTVPDVTANPTIHIPGKYHGFLRGGWLEEC